MLPAPSPFWGGSMSEKFECQKLGKKENKSVTIEKYDIKVKHKQKYNWDFTVNFVSFVSESDRQRSYELWVESFFHFVN